MPLTDQPSVVAQALVDWIKGDTTLGLQDVWFGDQVLIPRTPAVAVDLPIVEIGVAETGGMKRNDFEVPILIYGSRLQDVNITRKDVAVLAEKVTTRLHADKTLGGNVVYGYVTRFEPGIAERTQVLLQAVRLIWSAFSKTRM